MRRLRSAGAAAAADREEESRGSEKWGRIFYSRGGEGISAQKKQCFECFKTPILGALVSGHYVTQTTGGEKLTRGGGPARKCRPAGAKQEKARAPVKDQNVSFEKRTAGRTDLHTLISRP